MSLKRQIAFRMVSQLYNVWIRRDEVGYDSRYSKFWFPFTVWREHEKKMLFCNREKDTIPHFFKLRKSCDWMSVQERKWEWGQPMMFAFITSCERWTCVEWERSRIGFRMKNHKKRSNEYCDCAFILIIIHLYLWTSICAVKTEYSQCFFLRKGMWEE